MCARAYLKPDDVSSNENPDTLHQVTQCVDKCCSNSQAPIGVWALAPPLTPSLGMGVASRVGMRMRVGVRVGVEVT